MSQSPPMMPFTRTFKNLDSPMANISPGTRIWGSEVVGGLPGMLTPSTGPSPRLAFVNSMEMPRLGSVYPSNGGRTHIAL